MGFTVPEAQHVLAAYKAFDDVDIIHDHTVLGPAIAAGHKHRGVPVVFTNHNLVTTSRRVHCSTPRPPPVRSWPSRTTSTPATRTSRSSAVIHHGIDVGRYPLGPGRGGYTLFFGRMNPDKGPERAIRIARATGMPLKMVVKMWEPGEKAFFRDVVEPMLGPDIELHFTSTHEQIVQMLRHAEALVNPINWHEPFGLVMLEALSCGTPVLAFARGAAPEIIQHGVTGWLGADEADLREALDAGAASSTGKDGRQLVETRFSLERMARDHERLYRRLINAKQAAAVGYGPRRSAHGRGATAGRPAPAGAPAPSEHQAFLIVPPVRPPAPRAWGPHPLGCSGARAPRGSSSP